MQHAFAGTLDSVDYAVAELRALADNPDVPPLQQHVLCGITGGGDRAAVRDEMLRQGCQEEDLIVDLAPAYLLNAGLPYSRSEVAVILDTDVADVPERYQDEERAQQLVSVVADAVPRDGVVVVPAKEWEVQGRARDARCRVAVFATDDRLTRRDTRLAYAVGTVRDGRIVLESGGEVYEGGEVRADVPVGAQVAAALAMFAIREIDSGDTEETGGRASGRGGES
ncbi:MAG: hypothetical protein KY464_13655 [Gemmatimonadetes bacterium]|nr:hypothetical protein [Gemmatimonadota bacterium]